MSRESLSEAVGVSSTQGRAPHHVCPGPVGRATASGKDLALGHPAFSVAHLLAGRWSRSRGRDSLWPQAPDGRLCALRDTPRSRAGASGRPLPPQPPRRGVFLCCPFTHGAVWPGLTGSPLLCCLPVPQSSSPNRSPREFWGPQLPPRTHTFPFLDTWAHLGVTSFHRPDTRPEPHLSCLQTTRSPGCRRAPGLPTRRATGLPRAPWH